MAEIVLKYIQSLLIWPVVVLIIGIVYKRTLSDFLKRFKKAEAYGVMLEASPVEQQKELNRNPSIIQTETDVEKVIKDNPKEVIKEFIKLSNGYWFEKTFNIIYGSQIALLEHLSTKGNAGEFYINLVPYYNMYVLRSGLPSNQMAEYLNFLKNAKYVEYVGENADLRLRITPLGVDFLSYIQGQYPEIHKHRPF